MTLPLPKTLETAEALARSAGEILLRFFRSDESTLDIEYKGARDLVTLADQEAEKCIVESLQREYPEDDLLSEEVGAVAAVKGGEDRARLWIVDPLDGTTNFTHGHPLFAVSIALWEGDEPLVGVIHAPYLRETYTAVRGGGAFCNGLPIRVSEQTELKRALLATGFSYDRSELDVGALECFRNLLINSREVRRGGSACLDLAHTASGTFSGFWEWYLKPHDVGAGALLIREAGGRVTDITGGDDYLHGRSLVAGSPAIHERLLDSLRDGPSHPGAPQ